MLNITRGKIGKAKKVVIYGPEGIGKSTFAAQFPNPIFIDTEGSTNDMDVARTDKPSSWEMLIGYVKELMDSGEFKTVIIDTVDWAEQLCIQSLCARYSKNGIEDFGYGNGYVYEKEDFGKFLNLLQEVVDKGINVVLTAHAQLKKFEQPDEMGAYDRWELKLGKKTSSQISPLVKEWADMVLFANYKTYAVAADKDGKKYKAQGGERVMYTSHHPCWDAKNRNGLPSEMPFEYSSIAHLFGNTEIKTDIKESKITADTTQNENTIKPEEKNTTPDISDFAEQSSQQINIPEGTPKQLADLMRANDVDESDIRLAVSNRGYFPYDTPITNYPDDFVQGCLIGAWQQLLPIIKENQEMPF